MGEEIAKGTASMGKIDICKPKQNDFPGIFRLLLQLWPNKELDREKLNELVIQGLEDQSQRYLIATHKSKIIGFVSLTIKDSLWQEGSLAHIEVLIVDKDFRNTGVGTRLVDAITKIAKENSCKGIELDSAFHRKEAHTFYESMGFKDRSYLFSKKLD